MREALLSIVVPVYNVEKYITKCLDSIINQNYDNIEVIVIDDGSTDKSGLICDKFALEDKRVKVIHTSNKGVSHARNLGIVSAKGKYLTFVDADDYVDEDIYEVLLADIVSYSADIAMCNMCQNKKSVFRFGEKSETVKLYTGSEMLEHFYGNNYVMAVVVWNKVYRMEMFDGIQFPEGLTREDEFVMHKIMYNAKIVSFRNKGLYHYMTHKESITRQKDLGRLNRLTAVEDRLQFFYDKQMIKLYYLSLLRLLNDSARCYFYVLIHFEEKEVLQDIRERFMNHYSEIPEMKSFFRKKKIYPKLFITKYLLIKLFYLMCVFKDSRK